MGRAEYQNWVTLREYVDEKFTASERATQLALTSTEKAMQLAQAALEVRLENTNQNMSQVKDDIRFLRESRALLEGKASQLSVNITFILALIGLGIAIATLIMRF